MTGIALITGAAHRIGRALTENLAADGWAVGVHYARSADAAQTLCADIEKRGGGPCPCRPTSARQTRPRDSFRSLPRCSDPFRCLLIMPPALSVTRSPIFLLKAGTRTSIQIARAGLADARLRATGRGSRNRGEYHQHYRSARVAANTRFFQLYRFQGRLVDANPDRRASLGTKRHSSERYRPRPDIAQSAAGSGRV